MSWREEAACAGKPLWLMFPSFKEDVPEAVAVCKKCRVRGECLDAALEEEGSAGAPYRFGIRGGLTPEEREKVYRRRLRLGTAA